MIYKYIQFGDDIVVSSSVIMKNVIFSFIKEHRETTLRSFCDVIDDVITMKIFLTQFGTIFLFLMSNWSCVQDFDIFKMAAVLSSRQIFLPELTAEVEYAAKIAMSICDILSIWSMF